MLEDFPSDFSILRPRLLAISGQLKGQIFDLGPDGLAIGREAANGISIADKSVSREHCVIRREGSSVKVQDLGSLNGTLVNGERVVESLLDHGDKIFIGNTDFIFLTLDEDLSSLLSDVRLIEDDFDAIGSVEIAPEQTIYFRSERGPTETSDKHVLKNFGTLLKLSTTLQSSQPLAVLQEQALQLIMEAVPSERGAIVLTGSRPDQFLSLYGRNAESEDAVIVSRGVVTHVLEKRTALLTNDPAGALPHNQTLVRVAAKSVLCVPLLSGGQAFGAIYLSNTDRTPQFEESHLELLTAMAAMLALPLESARRLEWLESENLRLQSDITDQNRLIGRSPAMKQLFKVISRVAQKDSTVLIRGESGTGKELIARAIHQSSSRAKAPMVVINCAALKGDLLESELFGHEKGAFTSAIAQKKGKFEIADGGTVFLDEVAELAPELQVKLLRVLQEREIERVGGLRPIKVDVRVIAATDQDLEDAMRRGAFRHQLYYRLNVVSLLSPALKQRKEDLALLANYFAARFAERYNSSIRGISAEAEECLLHYDWPGNVRELQNAIERAVVLGESELILPEDLPDAVLEARRPSTTLSMHFHDGVREAKRRIIQNALEQTGNNHVEAAKLLGLNRTYLYRLMRLLDL
jgi:transcriptional regulator with GAF, ATPase, and Fis domain